VIGLIADACIHVGGTTVFVDAIASVDVTEHVESRPNGSDPDQQLLTTEVGGLILFRGPASLGFRHDPVQDPAGWPMGNQDVRAEGDLIPLLP
jgi:hypothetical protein